MWITWKHQDRELSWPLSFEQKVELFYEQALGWQLHIADLVANGGNAFGEQGQREGTAVSSVRHSGFAVLQICLSYFETIGRYTGVGSGSKAAFGKGVLEVFPELAADTSDRTTAVIDSLYKDARCGLYHNVRSARVGLGWPPDGAAIAYDSPSARVVVNPERLPKVLKAHLERFCDALLNKENEALQAVFETRFDVDMGAA